MVFFQYKITVPYITDKRKLQEAISVLNYDCLRNMKFMSLQSYTPITLYELRHINNFYKNLYMHVTINHAHIPVLQADIKLTQLSTDINNSV
jgi:hypothetical protein